MSVNTSNNTVTTATTIPSLSTSTSTSGTPTVNKVNRNQSEAEIKAKEISMKIDSIRKKMTSCETFIEKHFYGVMPSIRQVFTPEELKLLPQIMSSRQQLHNKQKVDIHNWRDRLDVIGLELKLQKEWDAINKTRGLCRHQKFIYCNSAKALAVMAVASIFNQSIADATSNNKNRWWRIVLVEQYLRAFVYSRSREKSFESNAFPITRAFLQQCSNIVMQPFPDAVKKETVTINTSAAAKINQQLVKIACVVSFTTLLPNELSASVSEYLWGDCFAQEYRLLEFSSPLVLPPAYRTAGLWLDYAHQISPAIKRCLESYPKLKKGDISALALRSLCYTPEHMLIQKAMKEMPTNEEVEQVYNSLPGDYPRSSFEYPVEEKEENGAYSLFNAVFPWHNEQIAIRPNFSELPVFFSCFVHEYEPRIFARADSLLLELERCMVLGMNGSRSDRINKIVIDYIWADFLSRAVDEIVAEGKKTMIHDPSLSN